MILAALGAECLSVKRIGIRLVGALCVMSTLAVVENSGKSREDWRGATNALLTLAQPEDAVVFFPFYSQIMLDYYAQVAPQPGLASHVFAPQFYGGGEDDRDLLHALDTNPNQFRHVWVAVLGQEMNQSSRLLVDKLYAVFGPPYVRQFTGITLLKFGK